LKTKQGSNLYAVDKDYLYVGEICIKADLLKVLSSLKAAVWCRHQSWLYWAGSCDGA